MRKLIREIEGDGYVASKPRLLSFKEFCQYVYEPSQTIKALNLPEEERLELTAIIEKRLNRRR